MNIQLNIEAKLLPTHPRKRDPLDLTIHLKPATNRHHLSNTVHVPQLTARTNTGHTSRPCEERPGPGPIAQYNKPKRVRHNIIRLRNTPLRAIRQAIHQKRGPGDHALAVRDRCVIRCLGLQRLHTADSSSSPGPDREE